jgi:hypothetical protein
MNDGRHAEIAAALRQYRETVTQHSFSLLRTLVEPIEVLPPPPKLFRSHHADFNPTEI